MDIQIINLILGIAGLIMFVVIFILVIRIWNFQQEVFNSGGYPTVSSSRAKRDASLILDGRAAWDYKPDEIIAILSRYPDDPEAAELRGRLESKGRS